MAAWPTFTRPTPPARTVLDPGSIREAATFTRAADWRVGVAALVGAAATDLAVRSGIAGVAGAALVVVVGIGLLASGRVVNPQAWALVGASALFAPWLAWRFSPWLLPLDVLVCGLLLVAGASLARQGSVFAITLPAAVLRAAHAAFHGLTAPAFVAGRRALGFRPSREREPGHQPHPEPGGGTALGMLRGLGIAVPVVVTLGLLMGSADTVFAGFFNFWSPYEGLLHVVLWVVGAWGVAGLARLASAGPCPLPPRQPVRMGTVEATVVVGSVVALFSAFCVAQLVALSEGGRHVIETSGLTYAEYARSGFFQLLAVAVLTLAVLLGLRALVGPAPAGTAGDAARARLVVLGEACVVLTLVVVVVALRRLALYEDAFGLTMLRLYSQVFAVWVGVAIALLGVLLAGILPSRTWYPAAVTIVGLCALLTLNVVNPEAVVVRHNVDHALSSGRFDPGYLNALSDDAVPALVASLPRLAGEDRAVVLEHLCSVPVAPTGGWAAANRSRQKADAARRQVCVPAGAVPGTAPFPV